MAFLTIITRSFRRPKSLVRCVDSVAHQTDQDVEQIIVHDPIGRGVEASYTNLKSITPDSLYVMLLDDDDYLIEPLFIERLKVVAVREDCPDVIFVGMDVSGTIMPVWEEGLRRGYIACSCFVVRRNVWLEHIKDIKADYSADFYFIESIMNCEHKHTSARLDMVASRVGKVSHGQPENIPAVA